MLHNAKNNCRSDTYETTSMRVTFRRELLGLGELIKEVRLKVKRLLTQLAADAGIRVPHWHRIRNEKVGDLPLETLRGIEKSLDLSL